MYGNPPQVDFLVMSAGKACVNNLLQTQGSTFVPATSQQPQALTGPALATATGVLAV